MSVEPRRSSSVVDRDAWRVSLVAMGLALGFWLWFQVTKLPAIQAVDPFAEDPYDLVGSIAIQAAVGLGLLSLARASRARRRPVAPKRHRDDLRFVLRGVLLVLAGVAATVAADLLAIAEDPRPLFVPSFGPSAFVLVGGLAALSVAAAVALALLALAWRDLERAHPGLPARSTYRRRMLAEAALDVVRLAWLPVAWLAGNVEAVRRPFDPLAARLMRDHVTRAVIRTVLRTLAHPWWTLTLVAAGTGVALVAGDILREGPPQDGGIALLVLTIFVTVETAAVLGGFLLFGAYLGLRPPLRRGDRAS